MNANWVKDGGDYVVNGHKWLITLFPEQTKLIYAFAVGADGPSASWWTRPATASSSSPWRR
ncbi:MAG: hypothetical protein M5U22_01980 [Thermoleophilia bacterium]|nr:hypothetical protein [Thermoleophilia bacterium]